jgi:hypothetical protein
MMATITCCFVNTGDVFGSGSITRVKNANELKKDASMKSIVLADDASKRRFEKNSKQKTVIENEIL